MKIKFGASSLVVLATLITYAIPVSIDTQTTSVNKYDSDSEASPTKTQEQSPGTGLA